MQNSLIISNCSIRKDAEGRFCLNDLHKAAGSQSKHQPSKWLITQQAIELVEYLKENESITRIPVIFSKQGVGTFVIKPLVYAYAMWISPIFHLHVIEAYDSLVTSEIPEHIIKAYDELVSKNTAKDLGVITEPMSILEFEARCAFHQNALENLKNVQVVISAKTFLSLKANKNI